MEGMGMGVLRLALADGASEMINLGRRIGENVHSDLWLLFMIYRQMQPPTYDYCQLRCK